jgi:pimeloyl-ACP methyl ester carboxylesterase
MGGAVAIVLAARRPDLVGRLVLAEANLDPDPPVTAGSSGIAAYAERDFVHGGGRAEVLGLYRSAVRLVRGTRPTMRELLLGLDIPRTYLNGELSGELQGHDELRAAGVAVVTVAGAGHCMMFDNPQAFVEAIARNRESASV